jgi:hypothetical protein
MPNLNNPEPSLPPDPFPCLNGVSLLHGRKPSCSAVRRPVLWLILCLMACSMQIGASALASPQNKSRHKAPDPNEIVRQMVATYRRATSIQETSVAEFTPLQGTKLTQSNSLKYQRPNRLVLISQDRNSGELAAYANGSVLRFYSDIRKAYREQPTPSDLPGIVTAIGAMANQLTGSGFDQTLNPVSFLLTKGMPREGQNFLFLGTQMVTGHKAYMVTCVADANWTKTLLPNENLKPDIRQITLYIDVQTHLLLRAKVRLRWTQTIPAQDKTPAMTSAYGFTFDEIHYNTMLDRPLRPEEFSFTPPRDVVRQN